VADEPRYTINEAELFAVGIPHPEGVAFDRAGWLYTGSARPGYNDRGPIYKISPDGRRFEAWADTGGRVLGLAFDRSGYLYACDSALGALFRLSPAGQVELFADQAAGRRLQKPNFLVFDRAGGLYVSDSGTARAGEPTGAVFYFPPDGQGCLFLDELIFPNGLALAEAEDELYVVQTRDNRVLRVPITAAGAAGEPVVFAANLENGPDGLALDRQGNLYVTITRPSQIVRVSPAGEKRFILADSADAVLHAPSNLAFGGPEKRHLYIANLFGQHITRLQVETAGLPLFNQR
jgi:gluconolactonase